MLDFEELLASTDIELILLPIEDANKPTATCDWCGEFIKEVSQTSGNSFITYDVWENNKVSNFCSRYHAAHYIESK